MHVKHAKFNLENFIWSSSHSGNYHSNYIFIFQGLEKSLDGHKILLLEAAPNKTQDINSTYSNRVSNITPGSKNLLESKYCLFFGKYINTTKGFVDNNIIIMELFG